MKYFFLILFLVTYISFAQQVQKPKSEMRGVWIATVVNIDWPKKPEDNFAKKKADFLTILETYKKMNFNAVIVQIRTCGDAFYQTEMAPTSKYLTGKEGQAVENNFDFMKWMIDESHKRGFEFHAWMNPYRATFDLNTEILSPTNKYFTQPDWMIKYGTKYYYNPGLLDVQTHLTDVVKEVVQKYDIDAIHFDDYFYPYKIANEVFDDKKAFESNNSKNLNIDDWRRSNVDSLMKKIHFAIEKIKPNVQFGISPFGVWRNNSVDPRGSDSQAGQTNYDDLYADPMVWMQNKWIDYLVPQLYWNLEHKKASHRKLMAWWNENTQNANLYIGNGTYKIKNDKDKAWTNKNEIPNQIDLARNTKNVKGNIYFSAESLVNKHKDVVKLMTKKYEEVALPPTVERILPINAETPKIISILKEKNKIIFDNKYQFSTPFEFVLLYGIDENNQSILIKKMPISKYNSDEKFSVYEEDFKNYKSFSITTYNQFQKESLPFKFSIDTKNTTLIPIN